MSMHIHTLAFCALLVAAAALPADHVDLPRPVKTCKRDSQDYTSCLRLALQESWLYIVKGIPELQTPVLDPFVVDFFETEHDFGDIKARVALRDVKTYGMAKINFLAVRPRFLGDRMDVDIDVEIPKVFIDGYYKADGQVSTYKIGGKGYFNVSMEGVRTTWEIKGRVENDRWIVEHFFMSPEVDNMKVYFDDLFNGNENLNEAARIFINEYWPVVYRAMLPIVRQGWDIHLTDFINRHYLSKVSVAKYFP